MKRIVVFLLSILLTLGIATAESIDVSTMDFNTLKELKTAVDLEFYTRPEATGMILLSGFYTVGKDINPGRYYAMAVEPNDSDYTTRLHIYATREKYETRPSGYYGEYLYDNYFHLGEDSKSLVLEEGNFLYLEAGSIVISASPITPSDYYTYKVPEGTYVPVGVYNVGDDIPAGKYLAYSGTIRGGDVKIYFTEEDFKSDGAWHLGYDQHFELDVKKTPVSCSLVLEDGYVVFVEKDIVMKKQVKLSFD